MVVGEVKEREPADDEREIRDALLSVMEEKVVPLQLNVPPAMFNRLAPSVIPEVDAMFIDVRVSFPFESIVHKLDESALLTVSVNVLRISSEEDVIENTLPDDVNALPIVKLSSDVFRVTVIDALLTFVVVDSAVCVPPMSVTEVSDSRLDTAAETVRQGKSVHPQFEKSYPASETYIVC